MRQSWSLLTWCGPSAGDIPPTLLWYSLIIRNIAAIWAVNKCVPLNDLLDVPFSLSFRSLTQRCLRRACFTTGCPFRSHPKMCSVWGSRGRRRPMRDSTWCFSLTTSGHGEFHIYSDVPLATLTHFGVLSKGVPECCVKFTTDRFLVLWFCWFTFDDSLPQYAPSPAFQGVLGWFRKMWYHFISLGITCFNVF